MSRGLIAGRHPSLVSDTNDYQLTVRSDAAEAAQRLGFDFDVQNAQGDVILQIKHVYEYINRPPETAAAVLLLFPVKDASLERVLRDAANAGITCAILNRRPDYVQNLRREFPEARFGTVGPDQMRGRPHPGPPAPGARSPRAASSSTSWARPWPPRRTDRLAGMREALSGVDFDWAQVHGDWNEVVAEKAVRQWLQIMRHTKSARARSWCRRTTRWRSGRSAR